MIERAAIIKWTPSKDHREVIERIQSEGFRIAEMKMALTEGPRLYVVHKERPFGFTDFMSTGEIVIMALERRTPFPGRSGGRIPPEPSPGPSGGRTASPSRGTPFTAPTPPRRPSGKSATFS
jgi:hypothetical protein